MNEDGVNKKRCLELLHLWAEVAMTNIHPMTEKALRSSASYLMLWQMSATNKIFIQGDILVTYLWIIANLHPTSGPMPNTVSVLLL